MSALSRSANPFDLVQGLPAHPLVVHAAVTLFPLALVGLLLILVSRALRQRLGWAVMVLLAVGALTVPLAKETGEALAEHIGKPRDHAQYAEYLVVVAFVTVVVAFLWWLLDRLAVRRDAAAAADTLGSHRAHASRPPRSALRGLLALLAGLLALVSMTLSVLVGHTGATATWKGEVASWSPQAPGATPPASESPTAAGSASEAGSPSGTTSSAPSAFATSADAKSYPMTAVREHSGPASCWTAIDGAVYDLTSWIAQHPGGPARIERLCGTDATAAFAQQHGGDTKPKERLATFQIGTLQK